MKKFMRIFILSFVVLFLGIINTNAEGLVCGTTMRYGSTGENVKALQTLLNEKVGCNLVVDGSYGSATKSCVVKYQQQANIQVDGITGPETCGMLTGTLEGAIKEYPESSIKKGIISVDVANVRQLPSLNSKSLGTVKSGRIVRILVDGNEWYKIKAGKTTGYIRKDLLSKNCILLDISDQRLYYFTEGQLLWSTRVVTGNQGNHDTPIGNYTLNPNNLEQDRYLKGTNDNGTKYNAHVDYWMPFILGKGIGFHDASWRSNSEYTKTRFQGNGSHGCVNMMHDAAQKLYESTTESISVVVRK